VADVFPAWSPNGSKIAFSRSVSPAYRQIYIMNADGSNQIPLTSIESFSWAPAWSPDGTRIAFTRSSPATDSVYSEIYVMKADGSNQTELTKRSVRTVNCWP